MKKKIVLIIAVMALIALTLLIEKQNILIEGNQPECVSLRKEITVRGSSMFPFIQPEQNVIALFGYYDCNPVLRNDIVLYAYSGNENFLIKFIRAVPGDRWNLKKTDNGYEIAVNDIFLLNSEGKPYLIPESSVKMLELYVKDYPVIPEDAYLLLGDKTEGSVDSTSFGLVGKKDIVAKVEIE